MANESEWLTRKKRIDNRLMATGWDIVPFTQKLLRTQLDKVAVEELPTANGPADYGLFVAGRLLGIIEAKKVRVNPQNVLEQAKRYAAGAFHGVGNWDGLRVPFLYASNGEIVWHLDIRPAKPVSRQLKGFHSPDALQWLFHRDSTPAVDWLVQTPPEQIGRLRSCQRNCILAVEKEIIAGRRDLLVAMATGTGKTFLTVAQIYRLLESKLVRKILFLVDRKALAAQAVREFNAFNTPKGNKFTQEYELTASAFRGKTLETIPHLIRRFCQTSISPRRKRAIRLCTCRRFSVWRETFSVPKQLFRSRMIPIMRKMRTSSISRFTRLISLSPTNVTEVIPHRN